MWCSPSSVISMSERWDCQEVPSSVPGWPVHFHVLHFRWGRVVSQEFQRFPEPDQQWRVGGGRQTTAECSRGVIPLTERALDGVPVERREESVGKDFSAILNVWIGWLLALCEADEQEIIFLTLSAMGGQYLLFSYRAGSMPGIRTSSTGKPSRLASSQTSLARKALRRTCVPVFTSLYLIPRMGRICWRRNWS